MAPDLRPYFLADKEEALSVARRIKKLRKKLDYMTVARAMVIERFFTDPDGAETCALARALDIERQTRINWLTRDLARWLENWRRHLDALDGADKSRPEPRPQGSPIQDTDLRWIAQQLLDQPWRSLSFVQSIVRAAAGRDNQHAHLKRIGKSTIHRVKYRIQAMMKELHDARQKKPASNAAIDSVSATVPLTTISTQQVGQATGA